MPSLYGVQLYTMHKQTVNRKKKLWKMLKYFLQNENDVLLYKW